MSRKKLPEIEFVSVEIAVRSLVRAISTSDETTDEIRAHLAATLSEYPDLAPLARLLMYRWATRDGAIPRAKV